MRHRDESRLRPPGSVSSTTRCRGLQRYPSHSQRQLSVRLQQDLSRRSLDSRYRANRDVPSTQHPRVGCSRILAATPQRHRPDRLEEVARHQRTRVRHVKAHLDPGEVRALLSQLCVKLGFCLSSLEIERLATSPPEDSDEFTEAVLVAEGYGVATSDPLFNQARELVAEAFVVHQSRTEFGPSQGIEPCQ